VRPRGRRVSIAAAAAGARVFSKRLRGPLNGSRYWRVQEVPPGPPDQVRRLERYRQEHPDVDIEPPGGRSAVWRAFRDGDLIAYGFTLMVFLERLEALPEPLGAAQDFGRRPCGRASSCPCQRPEGGRDGRHGMQDCELRAPRRAEGVN